MPNTKKSWQITLNSLLYIVKKSCFKAGFLSFRDVNKIASLGLGQYSQKLKTANEQV